jgi:chromosome segregation ATPase
LQHNELILTIDHQQIQRENQEYEGILTE